MSPGDPARPVDPPITRADTALDQTPLAIAIICTVAFLFAVMDAISRHLGASYSTIFTVMLRFWFMAVFVTVLSLRRPGGLRAACRSRRPRTQILRGLVLVGEVVMTVEGFVRLGLIETHAIFAIYPLVITALSGPILGERVGWRRWAAVAVGFVGMLVILQPGSRALSLDAAFPICGACLFALYGLLTRHVATEDPAEVSFFWTGIIGALTITAIGIWQWQPLAPRDLGWLAALCVISAGAHYLLIRAYALAEASALQPFAYLQLVFIAMIGVGLLGEALRLSVVTGAAIVVAAGLFTLARARRRVPSRHF